MYDNLFEPIQVGPVTIANRIVRSAHGTGLSGEDLISYHEARARGGVGMSTLEATGVHAGAAGRLQLFNDSCIPFYEQISARVAPYGMKLFQQLYHAGASYRSRNGFPMRWSPSPIANPMTGVVPIEMTQTMIDDVVAAFASAARRCREGGLDGVDIHASSGYLIHEFLSPATNHRTDRYGGSLENRMRFLVEVTEAIQAEVGGGSFAIGVRLPNEDHVPGGLTAGQDAEIAQLIEPLVDYVSLHMGAYWRFHTLIAPMDDPLGVELAADEVITRTLTKPTIVVGRIMTLDDASRIVASGAADMVSMVRALIADPELVNKARRGDVSSIRPCIGSNMGCVGQLMTTGVLSCVVNVAAARERAVPFDPQGLAAVRKRLLVVGGGPAGLEAARTAALRGHEVHLYEALRHLGGQVTMAATAPHRADLSAITEWLAGECERLGVKIQLGTMVDPDVVADLDPDEVIIATGGMPRRDGFQVSTPAAAIPGHDLPHVFTSWDVLGFGGRAEIEGPTVVFDDTGTFEAISVADVLLAAGVPVTMVARLEQLGANVPYPPVTVEAARERLMSGAFDFIGGHHVRQITDDGVEIGVLFTDRSRWLAARTVVIVTHNHPNRELAEILADEGRVIHLVGDVRGDNTIMQAIHQAADVARGI